MISFETFKSLSGVEIIGPKGAPLPQGFPGISTDSRSFEEGSIFCALKGERFDGHQYVREVITKGAGGAIVGTAMKDQFVHIPNEKYPKGGEKYIFAVPDTLSALQELANAHRRSLSPSVIGITGTNGKTSTKDMISLVLSKKYTVLKTPGNYNNQIGLPLTLLSLNEGHQVAVIEMGANHPGEISSLCAIAQPDAGVITNVGRGHLEYFGSVEGVAKAKTELIQSLNSPARGFINGDDPNLKPFRRMTPEVKTFGMSEGNNVKGEIVRRFPDGCALLHAGEAEPIHMKVPGTGQAYNALAAYAIGSMFEVPHEEIKIALESYRGSGLRGTWIEWKGGRIYNDTYNANPDSLQMAFSLMSEVVLQSDGRRIAVLGDMLELGERSADEHRLMGAAAYKAGFDVVYTYGDYSRELSQEASRCGVSEAMHFSDKKEIAERLKKKSKKATLCY